MISNPSHIQIKNAAKALKSGYLVAFPTETVYGLGADATNSGAVQRLYSVKGRPKEHPVIVHIDSLEKMNLWAVDIPDYARNLAKNYWPGPMTLLLKRSSLASDLITGGQDIVGLRIPNHPIALRLIAEFDALGGTGVVAPSANRFTAVSTTSAIAVENELGKFCSDYDLILDGGNCIMGIESTIINCTNSVPKITRLGALLKSEISTFLGVKVDYDFNVARNLSPGTYEKHYSPKANLRLNSYPMPSEGLIALAKIPTPPGVVRLAAPTNLKEYGTTLYAALRLGDNLELNSVVVILPPNIGLGEVLIDRIKRAAFRI